MAGDSSEERVRRLKAQFGDERKVNPFSWMVETICGVTMVDDRNDPLRRVKPATVRVALISMPDFLAMPNFTWEIKELSSLSPGSVPPEGVDPRAYARALVSINGNAPQKMLEVFRDALDAALKLNPHVVCFSELGLPSDDMVPMLQAKELAWRKSQEHNVLIVAGSAHDSRTLYNTAYLFRPGGPPAGQSFHKTVSARKVGELISAPASRRIVAVNFAGLRIAMMICLDIADYASVASVVKVADGIDVLLVPCYTPKFEDMMAIAKVASKALPGIVALVNAERPEASAKNCQIARFGQLEAPLRPKKLKSGAVVSLFEINHAKFQKARIEMKTSPDPDMESLFGRRDMPSVRTP